MCAVLHPNIWHGHGPGQIQRWLRRAQDSGLLLIPPLGPWRQALVAADCVIGDHGSVTYYAAALGRPVLLGAFPPDDLDPASPVAELGRTAPRLRPYEPLRPQLEALVDEHRPARYDALAALTTSAPSKSAELLRQTFYELMGRAEPERPAILDRLETPQGCAVPATEPVHVLTRVRGRAGAAPEIEVTRQAGGSHTEAGSHRDAGPHADAGSHADAASHADAHTAVHEHTRDPTRLSLADLVLGYGPEHPAAWTAATLRAHPHAAMAAAVTDAGCCLARTADGVFFALAAPAEQERYPDPCDPAVYASALYAWLMSGRSADELFGRAATMTVVCGSARHQFTVEVSPRPPARECPERYP
ncbi:MAG TPA: hypothetical protein VFH94_09305 [Streptomyces sp.]|nr:hypothetical protein [Streptomyces sp.]